jgi:hypothetical protein
MGLFKSCFGTKKKSASKDFKTSPQYTLPPPPVVVAPEPESEPSKPAFYYTNNAIEKNARARKDAAKQKREGASSTGYDRAKHESESNYKRYGSRQQCSRVQL